MPDDRWSIAIVEDDPIMGESLQRGLELEGWRVVWWRAGSEALRCIMRETPDLVLCDIRLGDISGEEVFRLVGKREAAPPFLFMTAYGQIDQAVSLVRAGAHDYLTKPFELASLLQKANAIVSNRTRHGAGGLLGVSRQMRQVEDLLRRMATRSMPVLITGETGSGKEVCARFLHGISPAAKGPFMAVNCAAIPADLLESEVFGHEKGAFSGAHQRHLGYAERARGGILFLDEIADMPLALQIKLLRVLEERAFHRVGGEASVPLNARIICATSANLAELIRQGRFREDLFYRINTVTVEVPPLRSRPEDIPWLLARYFDSFSEQTGGSLRGISSLAEHAALIHPWRGNARELRNRVERAIALASGPWLTPADLFPELRTGSIHASAGEDLSLSAVRDAAEKRQIIHVLTETAGQISEAARRLDVSRTTLWERMRRFGLRSDSIA
jgi:DNA-binding NtrC family response regulator